MEIAEMTMDSYLLTAESASPECVLRTQERLQVRVWWNSNGPTEPDDLVGKLACELTFTLSDDPGQAHRLQVMTEEGAEIDNDFVQAMARIYGVRGMVDAFVVPRSAMQAMGYVKVRG